MCSLNQLQHILRLVKYWILKYLFIIMKPNFYVCNKIKLPKNKRVETN